MTSRFASISVISVRAYNMNYLVMECQHVMFVASFLMATLTHKYTANPTQVTYTYNYVNSS